MTVNGLIVCGKSLAWGPQRLHSSAEGVFVDEGLKAKKEGHATRQAQGVRGAPCPSGRGRDSARPRQRWHFCWAAQQKDQTAWVQALPPLLTGCKMRIIIAPTLGVILGLKELIHVNDMSTC